MRREGYIIEFVQNGSYTKVSAVDPVTLTEVSIVGATNAGREHLTHLAVRKLEYMMAKKGHK